MPAITEFWPALALMGLIVATPWALKWARQAGWRGLAAPDQPMKLVSVLALGPQQKLVMVEVDHGTHRSRWVLGITPHSITRLDTSPAAQPQPEPAGPQP